MTPEGRVKRELKKLLARYGDDLYVFWPVQSRWGTRTLDVLGCHLGAFFAVETKRPGKDLTAYQDNTRNEMHAARGVVFRVSDLDELALLERWLDDGYDM